MPIELQPALSFELKEAAETFDVFERKRLLLISRLQFMIEQAITALKTPANARRHPTRPFQTLRYVQQDGQRKLIPVRVDAWEVPGTRYYVEESLGGVIVLTSPERYEGDLVRFEAFLQYNGANSKSEYLQLIGKLALMYAHATRIQRGANRVEG
jgi:hypothetical protein